MPNLSDAARSQGDFTWRIQELERRLARLESSRPLASSSIGTGGLRLIGGNITVDDGGEILVTGGRLVAGDPEGVRAEINNVGYRLINEDGEIDVDLTVEGTTNQIRLRGAGSGENQDNEILLSSNGEINGRVLNVEEVILDGQSLTDILEVLADAATPTSEGTDPEPPPPTGTITRTYNASWTESYKQNNTVNAFTSRLNQGFYSSVNGNQKALIRFPSPGIQADHGGRTITRVRVFLYFNHWYRNSGGTAIIGHHSHGTSPPSTFSATTDQVRSASWPKPGGRWVTYNVGMQDWATGAKTGIAIGPGPSTSRLYYGNAHSHGQARPPRLEIRSEA